MPSSVVTLSSKTEKHERSFLVSGLRTAFALGARLAPRTTTRVAASLFLRPRRHPRPGREAAALAGARRETLRTRHGEVVVWVWGRAPFVALVHGWEGRGTQLAELVAPLAAHGFGCVAPEAPGHGASPGARSSLVAIAGALEAAAARFGPLAGVVAHSAGAVATTFALTRGLQAERVAFLAPGADLEGFARSFFAVLGLPLRLDVRFRREVEARVGVRWSRLDPRLSAPDMTSPLLVIHDREDREAPLSGAEQIAARWPGAVLEPTRGLGHRRLLRDRAVVARVVAHLSAADATVLDGGKCRAVS